MLILLLNFCVSSCGKNTAPKETSATKDLQTKAAPSSPRASKDNGVSSAPAQNSNLNTPPPKPDTPENVFRAFQIHVAKGEFEKIYDLYGSKDKKIFDAQAKKFSENMKTQPPPAEAIALMKKSGVTEKAITRPQGRDLLRLSLVFIQIKNNAANADGKKSPVNVLEEFQKTITSYRLADTTKSADKKSAVIHLLGSDGQIQAENVVLENGLWKLVSKRK